VNNYIYCSLDGNSVRIERGNIQRIQEGLFGRIMSTFIEGPEEAEFGGMIFHHKFLQVTFIKSRFT